MQYIFKFHQFYRKNRQQISAKHIKTHQLPYQHSYIIAMHLGACRTKNHANWWVARIIECEIQLSTSNESTVNLAYLKVPFFLSPLPWELFGRATHQFAWFFKVSVQFSYSFLSVCMFFQSFSAGTLSFRTESFQFAWFFQSFITGSLSVCMMFSKFQYRCIEFSYWFLSVCSAR